jgi:hypothetical protein
MASCLTYILTNSDFLSGITCGTVSGIPSALYLSTHPAFYVAFPDVYLAFYLTSSLPYYLTYIMILRDIPVYSDTLLDICSGILFDTTSAIPSF